MTRKKRPSLQAIYFFFKGANTDAEPNEVESWRKSRPLNRNTFFIEASWAILVANSSVTTARTWQEKAYGSGFPNQWQRLGIWKQSEFNRWCKAMAKTLNSPKKDLKGKFRYRWWYVWDLAYQLTQYETEREFRRDFFGGKTQGEQLSEEDVTNLLELKKNEEILGGIGEVSMNFILANLGGDFIKEDVWIKQFCSWYNEIDVQELVIQLRSLGIHCGLFDGHCWQYCSREITNSKDLAMHFNELFGTN